MFIRILTSLLIFFPTDKAMTSVLLPRWTRQDRSPVIFWTWRIPFSGELLFSDSRSVWMWITWNTRARGAAVDYSPSVMYLQVHRHHSKPPSWLTLHLPIWEHVEHRFCLQYESGDGCIRWKHTWASVAEMLPHGILCSETPWDQERTQEAL